MARCCCGKYKMIQFPFIYNGTVHQELGPGGNFCGPVCLDNFPDAKPVEELVRPDTSEVVEVLESYLKDDECCCTYTGYTCRYCVTEALITKLKEESR